METRPADFSAIGGGQQQQETVLMMEDSRVSPDRSSFDPQFLKAGKRVRRRQSWWDRKRLEMLQQSGEAIEELQLGWVESIDNSSSLCNSPVSEDFPQSTTTNRRSSRPVSMISDIIDTGNISVRDWILEVGDPAFHSFVF
jgi:hypothetical protein